MDEIIKNKFISIFIENAKFSGISEKAAFDACISLNLEPNHFYLWFYDGLPQIVQGVEKFLDEQMLQKSQTDRIDDGITVKIKTALISRINNNGSNYLILKALARFYSQPNNLTEAPKASWSTVSKIWYYAGDKSTDWNYYSKRLILMSIYSSAIIYYLSNEDIDFTKTTDFINVALIRIGKFSKLKKQLTNIENIPILRLFI